MKRIVSLLLTAVILVSCCAVGVITANAAVKTVPGYYVVGSFNSWAIDISYLMSQLDEWGNHYVLFPLYLEEGDELKAVYSADGISKDIWYPDGGAINNLIVNESGYYSVDLAFNRYPDNFAADWEWYMELNKIPEDQLPTESTEPTNPEEDNSEFMELWKSGAELTADDIEVAVNDLLKPQKWLFDDKITIYNSHRFDCTPAYVVDYEVEGYGFYACVIQEEIFGDYMFYSTSSYEPEIFINDKLYSFTKAYKEGVLTQEMLKELVETGYKGGNKYNRCNLIARNIKGDADGDADVTAVDATLIQRYDIGMVGEGDIYKPLADVDSDGSVDVVDATFVQRYTVGLGWVRK